MKKRNEIILSILTIAVSLIYLAGCSNKTDKSETGSNNSTTVNNSEISSLVNNDVLNTIVSVKTARTFLDDPVPDEDIKKMLTAAMAAPTSGNQKAWEFIVVKDKNIMAEIQKSHSYSSSLDTAPVVIVVAADLDKANHPNNWVQDTSIAAENILIEASGLGISTNIMSIYPQEERMTGVQKALNLPENIKPCIMISIGYSDEIHGSASTVLYDADKVHFDKWDSGK